MQAIELNDPVEIEAFLSKISLSGSGFNSDCLLIDVYDAGLDYPDFLKAEGSDPDACYDGKSPAWAKYHVRQGKRVFMIYGGSGDKRRSHFSETPWRQCFSETRSIYKHLINRIQMRLFFLGLV